MEKILPQETVDVIGDVVTHLMAEEAEPIQTDGPVVEEIKEEEPKSDDSFDDIFK